MDTEKIPHRFEFTRDSFAFANELLWEYETDPGTGKMNFRPRVPKPDYALRCFVLTRAARQFLYHAQFDATHDIADGDSYQRLVRAVVSRSPRQPCEIQHRITISGFAGLRDFSRRHERLLKAECGGAWRSYVLRSHWRMIFPISRNHQQKTATRLMAGIQQGIAPIVHLVKFPSLTINHGMILFAAAETQSGWEFSAYDPNDPTKPVPLTYDQKTRTFFLPANRYWAGGDLNVIEIYRNWWM
ncbi:MAG TPA: hypothetical protein VFF11_07135 [Candidatus Binatia bacterium]|nr:hypothetical protein [Candidatus Binatia bacterium]